MSAGVTGAGSDAGTTRVSHHYRRGVIGIMLLLMITIGYIDRMTMSISGPVIAQEFGLSPFTMGLLFSAFFWGYAAMMVPGGWFIDRFGKNVLLPVAVFGWTLVSIATGFMTSAAGLFGVRIFLGVGEAPAYPTGNLVIREWVPLKERGVFTSLMQTGSLLGPGLATAPAAYVVSAYGWRAAFVILSSLGFVWLVGWLILYRSPEKARWITDDERDYIVATREKPTTVNQSSPVRMSIPTLLQQRSMLGIMAANGVQTYAAYFLLTWLPSYLVSSDRHFDLAHSGNLTSAMYLFATVATIVLGRLADRWLSLSDERAKRGERRLVVAVLMVASMVALAIAPWVVNQYLLRPDHRHRADGHHGVHRPDLRAAQRPDRRRNLGRPDLLADVLLWPDHRPAAPIVTGWIVGLGAGFTVVFIITAGLLAVGTLVVWVLPTRQLQP